MDMLVISSSLHQCLSSVAPEHTVDKVSQWAPEILSTSKAMLIDKQDVVLEACIKVSLEAEFANDGVMVAVDVGVDTIHALEYLSNHAGERLRKGNACKY
jgi:hypothetical protein